MGDELMGEIQGGGCAIAVADDRSPRGTACYTTEHAEGRFEMPSKAATISRITCLLLIVLNPGR
jgi:hypothetical protein